MLIHHFALYRAMISALEVEDSVEHADIYDSSTGLRLTVRPAVGEEKELNTNLGIWDRKAAALMMFNRDTGCQAECSEMVVIIGTHAPRAVSVEGLRALTLGCSGSKCSSMCVQVLAACLAQCCGLHLAPMASV